MIPFEEKIQVMSSFLHNISNVSISELSKIRDVFDSATVKKNDFFIKAGEKPEMVGFIISGLFRYFYIDKNGKEYTKYFAVENDFLISYSANLLGEDSKFYIEALEDSEILITRYKTFSELIESSASWDRVARKLIENQYIIKEKREYQFLFDDAETRYKYFLDDYPGMIDKVKHYHIASYLGISPVSLSRVRKKIKS